MLEETVSTMPSSIWESMNSWFTPTVLFVLLNIMIGTIAFTSTLSNQKQQHKNQENRQPQQQQQQQQPPHMLARSASVLQRLRSINFYGFIRPHETSHFKSSPDSDNLDHTHHPQILESQSQYIFGHTHQESPNLESHHMTNYIFRQENHQETHTHQESPNLETTHYIFRQENHQETQTHQESSNLETTHHVFRQENHKETQTHQESRNLETTHNIFRRENHKETQTHQESRNLETTHNIFRQENYQETLTHYEFQQENHTQFVSDQERAEGMDELQSMDEIYSRLKGRQVTRCKSDPKPSAGKMPARPPAKMKKSASMKPAFHHIEEKEDDVEPRRPETTREISAAETGHEVDAKADDFINRFKKQLELQRLDSILRYKEMIGSRVGK